MTAYDRLPRWTVCLTLVATMMVALWGCASVPRRYTWIAEPGVTLTMQGRKRHEGVAEGTQEGEIGQGITRALKKEHRNPHSSQMLGALRAGTACRMQGKPKKHEPAHRSDPRTRGRSLVGNRQ